VAWPCHEALLCQVRGLMRCWFQLWLAMDALIFPPRPSLISSSPLSLRCSWSVTARRRSRARATLTSLCARRFAASAAGALECWLRAVAAGQRDESLLAALRMFSAHMHSAHLRETWCHWRSVLAAAQIAERERKRGVLRAWLCAAAAAAAARQAEQQRIMLAVCLHRASSAQRALAHWSLWVQRRRAERALMLRSKIYAAGKARRRALSQWRLVARPPPPPPVSLPHFAPPVVPLLDSWRALRGVTSCS
jgi:hypothetical protein